MDCIILAGGIPEPDDPLYPYSQGRPKALIELAGRPMVAWVVDALQGSSYIDDILIVGLDESDAPPLSRPVYFLPNQNGMVANALAGLKWAQERRPAATTVMMASADIPTLTTPIVDYFVESCRPFDCHIYYAFVTQEVMETRFPHSRRTFVPLKGMRVAGGDLIITHPHIGDSHHELWTAIANARKHAWKLASIVGLRMLLKFLFRRLSVADIEQTATRILDKPVKALLSPHAELAMDADKPYQIDMLQAELAKDMSHFA